MPNAPLFTQSPLLAHPAHQPAHAISNLTDNAERYAGRAHLNLQREASAWVLDVDDWGPGIAPEQMQRLLQPFQPLDDSRNSKAGGGGCGWRKCARRRCGMRALCSLLIARSVVCERACGLPTRAERTV